MGNKKKKHFIDIDKKLDVSGEKVNLKVKISKSLQTLIKKFIVDECTYDVISGHKFERYLVKNIIVSNTPLSDFTRILFSKDLVESRENSFLLDDYGILRNLNKVRTDVKDLITSMETISNNNKIRLNLEVSLTK
ncbi:hypothetical protein GF336_00265 [Candidatus Woesearchaeota archaeon]|nr:hypothetical protein [Candidatus Woesearchaeota archaeon]